MGDRSASIARSTTAPKTPRSQVEVERLEKVIAALREALSGIAEYCSGDGQSTRRNRSAGRGSQYGRTCARVGK